MKQLITKLTNLIEVKKIIALTVIFVFCALALTDRVDTVVFTNVVTLVVGYYFGQSSTRAVIRDKLDTDNHA